MVHHAERLVLRRDMVTLLTYVRDTKVVGTQSTGNMPLKSVREVTARFINPPELETKIGDRIYRLRSEADLWPLYFLHILAEVGGLVSTGPARRWRLTREGKNFLSVNPVQQVWFLMKTWWFAVNWLVAYPLVGMGDDLPPYFNLITLARIRSLPLEISINFEDFADGLIEETGLTWTAPDSSAAGMLLRGSIERMVIDILAEFGAVECGYREVSLGKGTATKLASFEIKPFGKVLIEALR